MQLGVGKIGTALSFKRPVEEERIGGHNMFLRSSYSALSWLGGIHVEIRKGRQGQGWF